MRSARSSHLPRAALAALTATLALGVARAQTLDLSAQDVPKPGDGGLALSRAAALEAWTPDASASPAIDAAAITLARSAASMLRSGESAGIAGSILVLRAHDVADIVARLEEIRDQAQQPLDDDHLYLVELWARASSWEALATSPQDMDRALRNGLWPLAHALGSDADITLTWWPDTTHSADAPDIDEASLERWSAFGVLDAGATQALRAWSKAAPQSQDTPSLAWAHRAASHRVARGLDAATRLASALDPASRAPLESLLERTIADFTSQSADANSSARALAELDRLALLHRALDASELLGTAASKRAVRSAIASALAQPTSADWARSGALLARLIDVLDDRSLPADPVLPRQLKPTWKLAGDRAKRLATALAPFLADAVAGTKGPTDPGLLTALSALREARAMQRLVIAAAVVLSGPSPQRENAPIVDPWRPAADHLLKLTQTAGAREDDAKALTALRQLLLDLSRFGLLTGEDPLRAAAGAGSSTWEELTGQRTAELLGAIDRERAGWARTISSAQAEPAALRLDALTEALWVIAPVAYVSEALARAPVEIEGLRAGPVASRQRTLRSNRWAAWTMDDQDLRLAITAITPQLQALAELALDGDPHTAIELAESLRSEHAIAILAGLIEQRAAENTHHDSFPAWAWPTLKLTMGSPPPGSWLSTHRAEVANACRYWAEAARKPGTPGETLRAFAQAQAASVLDALRRQTRPEG